MFIFQSGDKNGRVTIKFDTREVDILPIKDFRAFDFGDKVMTNFNHDS